MRSAQLHRLHQHDPQTRTSTASERARGIETAYQAQNVLRGLDLWRQRHLRESARARKPSQPDTVGKRMIRLPDWRRR